MDLDATQPLDTAILSAAGRAAVPRHPPPSSGAILANPTPLGAPTRIRMPGSGTLLAPDSQTEETPLAPAPKPPLWDSSTPRGQSAPAAPGNPVPADTTAAVPIKLTGGDEEEQEVLLLPSRSTTAKTPKASTGARPGVSQVHRAAVEAAMAAVSGASKYTLEVADDAATYDEAHTGGGPRTLASPTLVGESSSSSGGLRDGVADSAAASKLGSAIADDVAVVQPSPGFHGEAVPRLPYSIEPTMKVCEPSLLPTTDLLLPAGATRVDREDNDEAYAPELRPSAQLQQRGVAQPPPAPAAPSLPTSQGKSLMTRIPSVNLSPIQGGRASLAAARPAPIVQPDAQVEDPEFKTPDRVLRRSQEDAPLVPPRSGQRGSALPPDGGTVTPSRRKTASPSATKLTVGDAVDVKWGGGWYPAWVVSVAPDDLTVVVQWPDGNTETKARNVVRATRGGPTTRPAKDTTPTGKRTRDSSSSAKLERASNPQPSAEPSTASTKKVFLSATQIEALDDDLDRRVVDSSVTRPTTLLTPSHPVPWGTSAASPDLSAFVVVPLAPLAEGHAIHTQLLHRGCGVPRNVQELIDSLERGSYARGVVLLSRALIADDGTVDLDGLVAAMPSHPISAAALGLGLPLVPADRFLDTSACLDNLSDLKLRWPNEITSAAGQPVPIARRVFADLTVAVATPSPPTLHDFPMVEVLRSCGANVIDATDRNAAVAAKHCAGVYVSPSFQGQLFAELRHTFMLDLRFVLQIIVGSRSWPVASQSQLPHLASSPSAPMISPPAPPQEPAATVPEESSLNINSTDSNGQSRSINPGDDYYARAPGGTGEAILVRIEHRRSATEVAIRVFRPRTEVRLVGAMRKPMSVVELSPTLRSLPIRSLIVDLPLFILPPSYLDHVYIIKGPEAPLESLAGNTNGSSTTNVRQQRLRTPANAEPQDGISPPRVSRREVSGEGTSPVSKSYDRVEFLEPLAAESSYSSSLDSGRSGQPSNRRYFRSAMVLGRVVEIGTTVRFEHDPPQPPIPKLTAPEPVLLVGEVQQIYQEHGEGWFVVELRDDNALDEPHSNEVMVIPVTSTVEVMLSA